MPVASEYRIWVRDRNFRFLGEVDKFIKLDISIKMNEVSTWILEVDADSAAAEYFRENAANPNNGGRGGIYIERNGHLLLSGPQGPIAESVSEQEEVLRVEGSCDLQFIARHLASPHPQYFRSPWMTSTGSKGGGHSDYVPNKGSTGLFASSWHIWTLVVSNIGSSHAPAQRPPLPFLDATYNNVGAMLDAGAGEYTIARGENLFEVCQDIANYSDYQGMPFRIKAWQYDTGSKTVDGLPIWRVRFESVLSTDKPNVILSPELGTIGNYTYTRIPPSANRVLMAGSGEGGDRVFASDVDEASVAAYGQIEEFAEYTGANTDESSSTAQEVAKLKQEIQAILAEQGEKTIFEFEFRETPMIQYGRDFEVGDRVVIQLRDQETREVVRGANFSIGNGVETMNLIVGTHISKGLRLFDNYKWLKHRYSGLTKRTRGQ